MLSLFSPGSTACVVSAFSASISCECDPIETVADGSCVHTGTRSSSSVVHFPSNAKSGLLFVLSIGFNVHGRIYTLRSLAFSSGEYSACGTFENDDVGKCNLRHGSYSLLGGPGAFLIQPIG